MAAAMLGSFAMIRCRTSWGRYPVGQQRTSPSSIHSDAQANGHGTYSCADGSKYIGEFVDNKREGSGSYRRADGQVSAVLLLLLLCHHTQAYEGRFRAGMAEGMGRYRWPSGDWYYGMFHAGCMYGDGVYHWACGDEYVGQFVADQACGVGSYTWRSGHQYCGDYYEDRMHGQGRLRFPGGEEYGGAGLCG